MTNPHEKDGAGTGEGGGSAPSAPGEAGQPGSGGAAEKYFYFVDDVKYDWPTSSISGAQIRARIANLPSNYQLFLEKPGNEPDELVQDNTTVALTREHEGPPHLYTVAPATFG